MFTKITHAAAIALTAAATMMSGTAAQAGPEAYLGEITPFAGNFCPRATLPANGQLLSIAENSALFSLYGTMYGGDGRTTFALPDLRGRIPVSAGQAPGLSNYRQGERIGTEMVTLNQLTMPAHTHQAQSTAVSNMHATTNTTDAPSPNGNRFGEFAQGNAYASTGNLDSTLIEGTVTTQVQTTVLNNGGNQPFSIVQPVLPIQFCVVTQGIYPSRS
ncbi:phage tail protein [Thalassococcus sp. BH17M4-6]|uniref:phage tail protein n=1 Tax=Thalassococcus sp. BH17M4-6 TaxID=3413148 RepID=UPI003BBA31E2